MVRLSRVTKVLVSLTFTLAVVMALLTFSDLQGLDFDEYTVQWPLLAISFCLFLINYMLRAIRFREFLMGEIRFKGLLGVSLIHGALNYFFPMKMGEFSFPLLSRLFLGKTMLESGAALIICRVMDLAFVLLMFLVVTIIWDGLQEVLSVSGIGDLDFIWVIGGGLVMGGGLLLFLFRKYIFRVYKKWSRILVINRIGVPAGIRLVLATPAIWFCILGNFYFLAACLGYQIPLAAMVVVSVLMVPLSLIPVQGVANIGVFEVAWVSGLMLFGFSRGESLEIAVKVHLVLTAQVFVMLGLGGLLVAIDKVGGKYA